MAPLGVAGEDVGPPDEGPPDEAAAERRDVDGPAPGRSENGHGRGVRALRSRVLRVKMS